MQDIPEINSVEQLHDYFNKLYLEYRKRVYDKLVDEDEKGAADTLRSISNTNGITPDL